MITELSTKANNRRDAFPLELRERSQWLPWNLCDGRKIPSGKSNDPSTWSDFQTIANAERVAFVFSSDDPFTGIDLDDCLNAAGELEPWAQPILERFKGVAYAEVSPSGTGIKLTTRATKPEGSRCTNSNGVECYDRLRFWTMTGEVIQGFETIGDGQAAVDWLCETYLKPIRSEGTQRTANAPIATCDLLRAAVAYLEKVPPATKGNRNRSAFALGGHLNSFTTDDGRRLSDSQIFGLVESWNATNAEPLDDIELRSAVRSGITNGTPRTPKIVTTRRVTHYPGVDLSMIGGQTSDAAIDSHTTFEGIKPVSIGDLIDANPELRPVVIDGILRRGETANFIAAAKEGKSFLAGGLAWCIATGIPWLSHKVTQGRVLIIDNELHPETLASRLYRIATEMMIDVRDFADCIDVISLRGQNIDIHAIQSRLADIEAGTYTLAIVDALYRTLPSGTSENDNAGMMAIYNRLDYYASKWDCAIAVVHHASKGQQGDKAVTDVGSGAGSISRAADTHIVIRPHEEPGLSVMECVTRSFKSPQPVSIRFEWPLWSVVAIAAQVRQPTRQNAHAQAKADQEAMTAILEKIPQAPKVIQQASLFERFGFGEAKCRRLVGKLVSENLVEIKRKRKKGTKRPLVFYSRSSESSSESNSESNSES